MRDSAGLVEMLKTRKPEAVSKLYDQYASALFGIVLRISKSPAHAELILEQTFLRIIKEIDTYQNQTSFFSWILNLARKHAIESTYGSNVGFTLESLDGFRLSQQNCKDLTEGMSAGCKEVLDHLYFAGSSLGQASRACGIPLDDAKVQLKTAMDHIRDKMGGG